MRKNITPQDEQEVIKRYTENKMSFDDAGKPYALSKYYVEKILKKNRIPKRGPSFNHTGERHGRLLVVGRGHIRGKKRYWECKCDCGETKFVRFHHLKSGEVRSCGCLFIEIVKTIHITHGMAKTPEHRIWMHIKGRCFSKTDKSYHNYGGRGITMCQEWVNSFEAFFKHIGPRPSSDHSIDRINNDGNYEPGNVRWATKVEQMNNFRPNVHLVYRGEKKTLAQWARQTGIAAQTLRSRLIRGWSAERTIESPVRGHKSYRRSA